jgi:PAS domain S-box-containing protein
MMTTAVNMEHNSRILVLDDELGPREALRMMLKSRYEVITASTGSEALEVVRRTPPDLAILDINMREMNGIEVLKAIKAIDASIEVVMMTAYASLETAREVMSHGISEYLIKPFSKADVEAAVSKSMARRHEAAESRQEVRALLQQMRNLTDAPTQGASYQDFVQNIDSLLEQSANGLRADAAALHLAASTHRRITCERVSAIALPQRTVLAGEAWCAALGQVLMSRQPVLLSDNVADFQHKQMAQILHSLGYEACVLFPILAGHETLGAVSAFYQSVQTLPPQWRELGQTYPDLFTLAIRAHQRYQTSQQETAQQAQRVAQLSILREIVRVIVDNLDLDAMLQAIGEQLQSGLGYAGFHVWLHSQNGLERRHVYGSGADAGWEPQGNVEDVPGEVRVARVDGSEVVIAPLVLDGCMIGTISLTRDVQQGALAEFELELIRMVLEYLGMAVKNSQLYGEIKETKSYLENLINDAGDAIITVDTGDLITSWNASAEHIFQYPRDAVLGQNITAIFPCDEYLRLRYDVLEEGQVRHIESQLAQMDSTPVECSLTLSPLHGVRDEIVGFSIIIRDITREKQLREQLLQSEKLRALGEMAAGVAHNFNNLLGTILGHTELLLEEPEDVDGVKEGLRIIHKASKDAAQVVHRIQTFARGSSATVFVPTDLQQLIEETVEVTQSIWGAPTRQSNRPIDVTLNFAPVPLVHCRAAEIREVVTNFIINAVDAMPQGGKLTLATYQRGSFVCIEISDTGTGMPEAVQRRIFDPFFTTKGTKGTGLGLSVSHSLIKGHGGDIEVRSTEGCGTTFVLKLPGQ